MSQELNIFVFNINFVGILDNKQKKKNYKCFLSRGIERIMIALLKNTLNFWEFTQIFVYAKVLEYWVIYLEKYFVELTMSNSKKNK